MPTDGHLLRNAQTAARESTADIVTPCPPAGRTGRTTAASHKSAHAKRVMTVWIRTTKTNSPARFHITDECSMVRNYPDAYEAVDELPTHDRWGRPMEPCRNAGPCRRG